jgi:tetratricopeptide (TPR) repeat protein
MKILSVLLILFVTMSFNVSAVEVTQMDKTIIQLLFEGQWAKSDSIIAVGIISAPEHPKYYFLKAYNAFYCRMTSPNALSRDKSIEVVKEYAWKAIMLGQKLPESAEKNFYLGCAYGFLCRTNFMQQDLWLTYWNARSSRNYLEKAIESDASLVDAAMGLAVLDYFPAAALTGYRKVLAWLGMMSGNRATGLQRFNRVAEEGVLFRDEALYALAIASRYGENKIDKSLGYWDALCKRHPGNNIFINAYRQTKLFMAVETKGVKYLEENIASIRDEYGITNAFILNSLGYYLMNLERYADAQAIFLLNVKLFPEVANCYDSLAECYLNQNDKKNALKYYTIASQKLAKDTTATPEFRQSLQASLAQKLKELGSNN